LINCVFPGVPETLASALVPAIMLISEDFPTLDRPINAYSGKFGFGHVSKLVLLFVNFADRIIIIADFSLGSRS
jgi:hypothetical protein